MSIFLSLMYGILPLLFIDIFSVEICFDQLKIYYQTFLSFHSKTILVLPVNETELYSDQILQKLSKIIRVNNH